MYNSLILSTMQSVCTFCDDKIWSHHIYAIAMVYQLNPHGCIERCYWHVLDHFTQQVTYWSDCHSFYCCKSHTQSLEVWDRNHTHAWNVMNGSVRKVFMLKLERTCVYNVDTICTWLPDNRIARKDNQNFRPEKALYSRFR